MEQWDLWLGEERVGKVSCRENGWGYTLWAACPAEEGYIYRVALDQENEDVLVAGVMLPQGREFRLEKKMDGHFAPEKVRGAFILRSRPGEYTGFLWKNSAPLIFPMLLGRKVFWESCWSMKRPGSAGTRINGMQRPLWKRSSLLRWLLFFKK